MRLISASIALLAVVTSGACGDDTPAPNDVSPPEDTAPLNGLDTAPDTSGSDIAAPDIAGPDLREPEDLQGPADGTAEVTPPDDAATEDTTPDVAVDTTTPDANVDTTAGDTAADDTTDDVDPGEGPIACDNEGFPALSAGYNDFGDLIIMEAYDADLPPFGVLGLEIYDGAVTQPGTYEIYPFNYRDCNLCVRIRTGCSWDGCDDFWVAESGRLVLSSWDTHFTGYLDDVRLRKVTIDPDTNISTPVAGPGWCVSRFYFNIQAD